MVGFLIKKIFFDGWDNLLSLVILNIGFIASLALLFFLPGLGDSPGFVSVLLAVPGLILVHVYGGTVSMMIRDIADFKAVELKSIVKSFINSWKISLILGVVNIFFIFIIMVAMPFYLSFGNLAGIAGAGLIFWVALFWLLTSQYIFPIYTRMGGSFFRIVKKSALLALDNPGYSLFVLIYSFLNFVLSILTALMIPGISGVLLIHQEAVKLRLYKYDWLEENPGGNKNSIPWDSLLYEDREKIGPRSLKGMIFPWKD